MLAGTLAFSTTTPIVEIVIVIGAIIICAFNSLVFEESVHAVGSVVIIFVALPFMILLIFLLSLFVPLFLQQVEFVLLVLQFLLDLLCSFHFSD